MSCDRFSRAISNFFESISRRGASKLLSWFLLQSGIHILNDSTPDASQEQLQNKRNSQL
jgi:hypothetical protein